MLKVDADEEGGGRDEAADALTYLVGTKARAVVNPTSRYRSFVRGYLAGTTGPRRVCSEKTSMLKDQ